MIKCSKTIKMLFVFRCKCHFVSVWDYLSCHVILFFTFFSFHVEYPPQSNNRGFYQQDQGFAIPGLSEPLVTNMAMQYGQVLVGQGKQLVDKELEKYVPVSRLKYYFAVDTSYVTKKIFLLLFPFTHTVSCKNA